jgi:hypothetical protein
MYADLMLINKRDIFDLRRLSSSHRIVRVMKSMRLQWTGHVTRTAKIWNVYPILVEKPLRKRSFGILIWDDIYKWILGL